LVVPTGPAEGLCSSALSLAGCPSKDDISIAEGILRVPQTHLSPFEPNPHTC